MMLRFIGLSPSLVSSPAFKSFNMPNRPCFVADPMFGKMGKYSSKLNITLPLYDPIELDKLLSSRLGRSCILKCCGSYSSTPGAKLSSWIGASMRTSSQAPIDQTCFLVELHLTYPCQV
jgi:hypothetical protein